jgi:hypothetical protein
MEKPAFAHLGEHGQIEKCIPPKTSNTSPTFAEGFERLLRAGERSAIS